MLCEMPAAKVRSKLKGKAEVSIPPNGLAMVWLNYELFLLKLTKMAADNAKADRSSVIRARHVEAARREILCISKG